MIGEQCKFCISVYLNFACLPRTKHGSVVSEIMFYMIRINQTNISYWSLSYAVRDWSLITGGGGYKTGGGAFEVLPL